MKFQNSFSLVFGTFIKNPFESPVFSTINLQLFSNPNSKSSKFAKFRARALQLPVCLGLGVDVSEYGSQKGVIDLVRIGAEHPSEVAHAQPDQRGQSPGRLELFTLGRRLTIDVVPGDELQNLVQQQNRNRNLQHGNPFSDAQRSDLKN